MPAPKTTEAQKPCLACRDALPVRSGRVKRLCQLAGVSSANSRALDWAGGDCRLAALNIVRQHT